MKSNFTPENGGSNPPPCNTGGNSVIRSQNLVPWRLDWLRLSFPESYISDLTDRMVSAGFFPRNSKPRHGYARGLEFHSDTLSMGSPELYIWSGGDCMNGKATLDCSGRSAEDVFSVVSRLSVPFCVRRVDLCLDYDHLPFMAGQDVIMSSLENWPFEGARPKYHKIDDMGTGSGSTLYVGSRSGEHMLRWYEKGLQMKDRVRPGWCRFEVEIKPKKSQKGDVLWILLKDGQRDQIVRTGFSSAFLPYFTGSDSMSKTIIPPEQKVRDFDDRIDAMVTQYGGLLMEMRQAVQGDPALFVAMIDQSFSRKKRIADCVAGKLKADSKGEIADYGIPF